jgi:hypothetical protein
VTPFMSDIARVRVREGGNSDGAKLRREIVRAFMARIAHRHA